MMKLTALVLHVAVSDFTLPDGKKYQAVKATILQEGNPLAIDKERGIKPVELEFPFAQAPALAVVPGLYELQVSMGTLRTQRTFNQVTTTKEVPALKGEYATYLGTPALFSLPSLPQIAGSVPTAGERKGAPA